MNHSQAIFGGEQRKWWIALVTLLAALALVQQAGVIRVVVMENEYDRGMYR